MRALIQRVTSAAVEIEGRQHAGIGKGMLILLGIEEKDAVEDVEYLTAKLVNLRIFADQEGKMNLDVMQSFGEIMVISQFTLHASTKKGNRPSFVAAANPAHAQPLYAEFLAQISARMKKTCKS